MFGIWFEQDRRGVTSQDKDLHAEVQQLLYQHECKRFYNNLTSYNNLLNGCVGIEVKTLNEGSGLILRDTFEERDTSGNKRRWAFILFPDSISVIGPLTPKSLEKAEGAHPEWRLARLALTNEELTISDLFDLESESIAGRLQSVIKASVENARREYFETRYSPN